MPCLTPFHRCSVFVCCLFLLQALTGCTNKVSPEVRATAVQCVIQGVTPERAYSMGESLSQQEDVGLTRWDAWGCKNFATFFFEKELRQQVDAELSVELRQNRHFREGMYAGVGPLGTTRPHRSALGKLGLALEDGAVEQQRAVKCAYAEPQAVAIVSQLDFPFATAVIGVQVDVGQVDAAQKLADTLLRRAIGLSQEIKQAECSTSGKELFLKYAQDRQSFYEGRHPWVPGCSVTSDSQGMRLLCSGPASAGNPK